MGEREGGEKMKEAEKKYTPEQTDSAKEFLEIYTKVPEDKKPGYTAVVTAFISGMEAQRVLERERSKEAG